MGNNDIKGIARLSNWEFVRCTKIDKSRVHECGYYRVEWIDSDGKKRTRLVLPHLVEESE